MTTETTHQDDPAAPWWADLGAWGAVALIAFGALAAAWVTLRLPGTPDNLASGYYGAAKVLAIGMVVAGTALLGRRRTRGVANEEDA
ncbi:hypothetical protein ABZY90_33260 [Streptomyces sp. NPDC006422]|uniref:hypothetical protein n=1 Tax=unclassified Streptomyces TaxID=2593676 RepID=UPI0033B08BD1